MASAQDPSPPSRLVITGVEGEAAKRVNGDYHLTKQESEGKPVWAKAPPNGLQLACVRWRQGTRYWCVRDTMSRKKGREFLIWALPRGAFPNEVDGDWEGVDRGRWVKQSAVTVAVGEQCVTNGMVPARKEASRQEVQKLCEDLLARTAERDALQARLQEVQEQLSKALACREQSSSWCAAGAQWEYEYRDQWHGFGLEASHLLLQAYRRFLTEQSPTSVEVNSGGVQREVEFSSMQQLNKATGVRRRVRLNLNVPTGWGEPSRLLAAVQDHRRVETDPTVLANIAALMQATAHGRSPDHPDSKCCDMAKLELVRVYRTENVDLWLRYIGHARHLGTSVSLSRHSCGQLSTAALVGTLSDACRDCVTSLSRAFPLNPRLNEVWLFHGTEAEAAKRITSSGFDNRVANEGLYGWGTYFSSQSCKSHQYAEPSSGMLGRRIHTMILSRVLLGCPYYAKTAEECQDIRRPPEREDAPAFSHDSLIANPGILIQVSDSGVERLQAHQEVVIYENALQAYPSYVVEYTVA